MSSNVVSISSKTKEPILSTSSTSLDPKEKKKPGRPPYKLTDEVRQKIISLTKDGLSQRQVGKALSCPQMVVSRVVQDAGISAVQLALSKARDTKRTYDSERRKEALDIIMDHAMNNLLPQLDKPGALYNFAVGFAVLDDKRRLEDSDSATGGRSAIVALLSQLSTGPVAGETT